MRVEELTQEQLDELLARAKQRSAAMAMLTGIMQLSLTDPEALRIKKSIMATFMISLQMQGNVGDWVEKQLLEAMRDHCEQEIAIEELISGEDEKE